MNKYLQYLALGLAFVAFGLSLSAVLTGSAISFGGASCSGVSGCTAFPGIMRVDSLQLGTNTSVTNTTGNLAVSSITQNGTTSVNVLNGITTMNESIVGNQGFNGPFTTSTTLTPAQFCGTTNEQWLGTSAAATATLPAATSSFVACGSPANGAWNGNWITNDSTNTLTVVAGTGMTFKCETQGVGTTTVIGGCTSSQISIPATSTVQVTGFWDAGSSTFYLNFGNMFH